MEEQPSAIAILGAGSWGTALGLYLARRHQKVFIWSIDQSEITAMLRDGSNERYLPGHRLAPSLKPTLDLETTINSAQDILLAIPSLGFRSTLQLLKPIVSRNARFICATKGLDNETGELCHEMLASTLGRHYPFAALSGPTFAKEVAAGLPTAVMVASSDLTYAQEVCARFDSAIFQAYPITDVIGVEIAAVAKNVIAIATGISDGRNLGANARSALITFGLSEITQLGVKLGAQAETFMGLAGIGDLILTCSDNQSRNRRLGLAIGQGKSAAEAEKEIGQVVEGKRNAELIMLLAKRHNITMPICETVTQILQGRLTLQNAYQQLLNRRKG